MVPDGRAIDCSSHYPGSVHDIDIFRRNMDFHSRCLRKSESELTMDDNGTLRDQYPDQWVSWLTNDTKDSLRYVFVLICIIDTPS